MLKRWDEAIILLDRAVGTPLYASGGASAAEEESEQTYLLNNRGIALIQLQRHSEARELNRAEPCAVCRGWHVCSKQAVRARRGARGVGSDACAAALLSAQAMHCFSDVLEMDPAHAIALSSRKNIVDAYANIGQSAYRNAGLSPPPE